ncbi:MAG: methylmalonyl Co-A mutase-associated GTPase MeaB [Rhodocyclaceae bacterium]|nr:methylmalonyl Co-A mutase-associated GTPase MeaB [Rhodocyclaceae bacterium]
MADRTVAANEMAASNSPDSLSPADRQLVDGVLAGRRRALAKAITLIESVRSEDQGRAEKLLDALLPHTGKSFRIGISGAPGAGKSTFIEAFGMHLVALGKKVAVLAIDPSSQRSKGSILGDKTRMERLAQSESAFIRPSPAAGALGGVAARTRETILLCEAAGYDVIVIETVGVGQSETAAASMTDAFVLLQLPNAGDELQGIKRGIMELADLIVINKADIDKAAAQRAAQQLESALHFLAPQNPHWRPPVLMASAQQGEGIDEVWRCLSEYRRLMESSGEWQSRRRRQAVAWLWQAIEEGLMRRFREHPAVAAELPSALEAVEQGVTTPRYAARRLLMLINRYF